MSRSAAAILLVLVVTALAACGSNKSGGSTTSKTSAATASDQNAAILAKCHATFDPILAKLDRIQTGVDGTRSFTTYGAEMSDLIDDMANFTSDRVPSATCLKFVSAPIGGALLQHYSVTRTWVECHETDSCKTVMPGIEAKWKRTGALVKTAGKGFGDVTAT